MNVRHELLPMSLDDLRHIVFDTSVAYHSSLTFGGSVQQAEAVRNKALVAAVTDLQLDCGVDVTDSLDTDFCSRCKEHATFRAFLDGSIESECCGARPLDVDAQERSA